MLADKLQLPPSIAGITLLALGNGQYVSVCVSVSWTLYVQSHIGSTWLVQIRVCVHSFMYSSTTLASSMCWSQFVDHEAQQTNAWLHHWGWELEVAVFRNERRRYHSVWSGGRAIIRAILANSEEVTVFYRCSRHICFTVSTGGWWSCTCTRVS